MLFSCLRERGFGEENFVSQIKVFLERGLCSGGRFAFILMRSKGGQVLKFFRKITLELGQMLDRVPSYH